MESNKKVISKKVIAIIAGIFAAVALFAVVLVGMLRDFDAQKYVRSTLNQMFQGNVEEVVTVIEGASEEELQEQYEKSIESFVENNIMSGIEMEDALKEKYIVLCKEIFKSMKYEIGEAEKVSGDEYKVPVKYQTVDVFSKFMSSIETETARIKEKAQKGEYQAENIKLQMEQEFLNNSYDLLNAAYQEMQYAEEETMIFTVKKDENDLFALDSNQINEFIAKIMGLDEIQD